VGSREYEVSKAKSFHKNLSRASHQCQSMSQVTLLRTPSIQQTKPPYICRQTSRALMPFTSSLCSPLIPSRISVLSSTQVRGSMYLAYDISPVLRISRIDHGRDIIDFSLQRLFRYGQPLSEYHPCLPEKNEVPRARFLEELHRIWELELPHKIIRPWMPWIKSFLPSFCL
jgi:hypothetical protein